jgi:peptidoglycan/xylan/chitin deacetylase (PgdA/CDA1 family)
MLHPQIISATPENFARQMRFLAKRYRVVSMPEVLEAIAERRSLPPRAVLVTFDDAYFDFGIAWSILKSLKMPATLFVPTAYPDQPERAFWWDRLHRAFVSTKQTELRVPSIGTLSLATPLERRQSMKRLQGHLKMVPHAQAMTLVDDVCEQLDSRPVTQKSVLSWKELRQLATEGVTLCAHTQTHPIMTQLSRAELRQEVVGSQNDLQREIGEVLPVFCYPSGSHDDTVVEVLKDEGFAMAFTTLKGQNDLRTADPLRLRRTNMTRRTSLSIFRLRLLRLGAYLDGWRQKRRLKKMR